LLIIWEFQDRLNKLDFDLFTIHEVLMKVIITPQQLLLQDGRFVQLFVLLWQERVAQVEQPGSAYLLLITSS
jgi:hypothetical protein